MRLPAKAWDLWLGTKEGKELAANWQSAATCYVKWGHAYPQYLDSDALENDLIELSVGTGVQEMRVSQLKTYKHSII